MSSPKMKPGRLCQDGSFLQTREGGGVSEIGSLLEHPFTRGPAIAFLQRVPATLPYLHHWRVPRHGAASRDGCYPQPILHDAVPNPTLSPRIPIEFPDYRLPTAVPPTVNR